MPCLNAAGTVRRSVQSVLATEGVELVVQDGGSTDGTQTLVDGVERVSLESAPDDGLSDAFNRGASRAAGDVLGWLNADDVYLPGALERVQAEFERDPALEWLTGSCLIVDGRGEEIRRGVTRYKDALLRRYTLPLHLTHNFVSAPATFFRRAAFERVGGMDTTLRYSMDYDLYLRLGRTSAPRVLDVPLAAFTMTEGTLSMTGFERQFVEHREVARRHGGGLPVAANALLSRGIVLAYRGMRAARW